MDARLDTGAPAEITAPTNGSADHCRGAIQAPVPVRGAHVGLYRAIRDLAIQQHGSMLSSFCSLCRQCQPVLVRCRLCPPENTLFCRRCNALLEQLGCLRTVYSCGACGYNARCARHWIESSGRCACGETVQEYRFSLPRHLQMRKRGVRELVFTLQSATNMHIGLARRAVRIAWPLRTLPEPARRPRAPAATTQNPIPRSPGTHMDGNPPLAPRPPPSAKQQQQRQQQQVPPPQQSRTTIPCAAEAACDERTQSATQQLGRLVS